MSDTADALNELVDIMAKLRAPDGCPWDREQDHHTLKQYLREETAELLDAIDEEDDEAMIEEMGDVLLQVIFHAQIARESERFSLQTVAKRCCEKLVRRHPHVFGESEATSTSAVLDQWEEIKREEKQKKTNAVASALSGVPKQISALQRAYKVQKKASSVGFDWPAVEPVCHKIEEELSEVTNALQDGNQRRVSEEIGDLLFSVTNLSRFSGHNPEDLLHQTVQKFEKRFHRMEALIAQDSGKKLETFNLETLDRYWEKSKQEETSASSQTSQ